MVDRQQIRYASRPRPGEQRLYLRAEEESLAGQSIIERLLADPIAREDQTLESPVPNRQGEHAARPGEDLRVPRRASR